MNQSNRFHLLEHFDRVCMRRLLLVCTFSVQIQLIKGRPSFVCLICLAKLSVDCTHTHTQRRLWGEDFQMLFAFRSLQDKLGRAAALMRNLVPRFTGAFALKPTNTLQLVDGRLVIFAGDHLNHPVCSF